jgi:hypothetical protein
MTQQLNIPAVVSMQHIVRNYMNERNYSMSQYKRLIQIAIRGFSDLSMTEMHSVSTVYDTPNANGQIFLPPDFVDYSAIGYRLGDKVYILSRNKSLYINKDGVNGDVETVSETDGNEVYYVFGSHYRDDMLIGATYGFKGAYTEQYFNIDSENKILQVSSAVPRNEMIIEYISTGVSLNGNTYIPRYAEQPMIEWLYWRDAKGKPFGNQTRGVIADSKQDFVEAVNVLRDIQTLPTYQEAMDAIYSEVRQSPKR